MKITLMDPPRTFPVGVREIIHLRDCGRVALEPDEQVTFVTESGTEYDVVRKAWGYYATPSLNSRLPSFGLKPVLVRSRDRLYLLLVERVKEEAFHTYLCSQGMEIVGWLDREGLMEHSKPQTLTPYACLFCNSSDYTPVFTYATPPPGETLFPLPVGETYHREIWQCQNCGHFANRHQLDLKRLYEASYVDATYGGAQLLSTFQRIMTLLPERSDNYQRVQRIIRYMAEKIARDKEKNAPTLLDVGSGLCVFPARMKEEGWNCTALDPDPRAVEHARQHVGIEAICGDFLSSVRVPSYDLITFNKVLEHVEDPIGMLEQSHAHLHARGVVYIELPDGEAAAIEGAGREEFFIEHFHAFSLTSVSLLAKRAGFSIDCVERIREPSMKYTLRAFLRQPTQD